MHAHDLVLKGGIVFCGSPPRLTKKDIAFRDGKISAIAEDIPAASSKEVTLLDGQYVLPGLIDIHTHVYWGGTPLGVNPDKLAPSSGVTTWVDMGSAGAGNFEGLYHHIIKKSKVRILSFLHLSYLGLVSVGDTKLRFGELFDSRLADATAVAQTVEKYRDNIKGLKLRIGMESALTEGHAYLDIALGLGERLGLPVVVHATSAPPTTAEVLRKLRKGDVFTHCFAASATTGILDRKMRLLPEAIEARDRGVLFDVGYGARSFSSITAVAALEQGFMPDFISSDLHAYSLGTTITGLPSALSKFLHLGMPIEAVLQTATSAPAEYLGIGNEAGYLKEGIPADLAILRWSKDEVDHLDGEGRSFRGKILESEGTYRNGIRLETFDDGREEAKWKPGLVSPQPDKGKELK
ncbi:MAG: amidohydrolase family protein [Syntrophorhabdaceae bacterium]